MGGGGGGVGGGGDVYYFPIYRVSDSNDSMLDEKETLFIKILQPSLNA